MKPILFILMMTASSLLHCQSNARYARFQHALDSALSREQKLRYARIWLDKARSDKNFEQEAAAIREMMYTDEREHLLAYSDSLLWAAINSKKSSLIGQAYLTKGISHYSQNQHSEALNAYMKADEYLSAPGSDYDAYKLKYAIANTKYYLGFYHEAIALFTQCLDHYKKIDSRGYLNSIYSLGLCYNRLGDYETCAHWNRLGFAEEARLENRKMHWYFVYSKGINDFYLNRFSSAIEQLSAALVRFQEAEDFSNVSVAWFYLGKSYLATNRQEIGLAYLEKVDSTFYHEKYIRPDLRQTFEILIDHYRKNEDYRNELYYIRRLKDVDSILTRDYKYLSSRIEKEYDRRKLTEAYQNATFKLRQSNRWIAIGLASFAIIVGFITAKYLRLRKYYVNYKKMVSEPLSTPVVRDKAEHHIQERAKETKNEKELNPQIVKAALGKLASFESKNEFRKSEIGLKELADILGTNPTYARQILQQHRGKGVVEYLRDLRLEYVVRLLRTAGKFRNYTDEALASECGFGSTQNFTRAFKAKYDIPPRYFIKQLKKDLEEIEAPALIGKDLPQPD